MIALITPLSFILLQDVQSEMSPMSWVLILLVSGLLLAVFIVSLFMRWLVKSMSGQAIVKTGFGLRKPSISMGSSFIVPLFHKYDLIDLTVKTVRIERRAHDSLSCADGIRAEVEVDFYIQINPVEEDIRRVAMSIGPKRASSAQSLREVFEAKFADALKTAGSKLTFDQLYQNRALFREEILMALGQAKNSDLVLNGFKLDDVAIQYLEQLPLEKHNPDNVLDAKGRKVIAERTSREAEEANKRLRQKEITIQEQNQQARIRDLQIKQDISEKEATQAREVREIQSRQQTLTEQTMAEQERLSAQALIAKEMSLKVAEENKQREIMQAQIDREKSIQVSEQDKQKSIEIAKIQREVAQTQAQKEKIKQLEEMAHQEGARLKAEEQAQTLKSLEIANRQKQIEVIQAEKAAAVETQMRRVESDVKAYELITVAKAKLDAAEIDAQSAEKQAKAIIEVGRAEAETRKLRLDAENNMNQRVLLAQSLNQLIPMLPQLIEKMMLPAEKIESIKVLHVTGMEHMAGSSVAADSSGQLLQAGGGNATGSIINTMMNVSMLMPVMREMSKLMQGNDELQSTLKELPGGEALVQYLQAQAKDKKQL